LEPLVRFLEKSERVSEAIFTTLIDKLLGKSSIAIVHCGSVEGVAKHLETLLRISLGRVNVITMNGDYIYNTVLPYMADFIEYALLFSSTRSQGCASRVRQALKLLGIDFYALLPKPIHEVAGYALAEGENVMELDEAVYRLSISLANIKLGLHIGRGLRRVRRMEAETKLSNIAKEVIEFYSNAIEAAEQCNSVIVSQALASVGEELGDLGYLYTTVDRVNTCIKFANYAMLFYTTSEEHIVREALLAMAKTFPGIKLVHVRINTDPLTAPLYGLVLALYIRLRKSIAAEERQRVI
jgi:hypothetical protein